MDFADIFSDAGLLIFSIPALLALLFWLVGLAGIVDFDALDFDVDLEADLEGGPAGPALSLIGLGLIPASLIVSLIFFFFGWFGIAFHAVLGADLVELGWGYLEINLLAVPTSFVLSVGLSAGMARLLHPLFRSYGEARTAYELLGKIAVVKSGSVTRTFGTASVRLEGGTEVEIDTRADTGTRTLKYGDRVLVIDYDPQRHTYLVEPYEELIEPA